MDDSLDLDAWIDHWSPLKPEPSSSEAASPAEDPEPAGRKKYTADLWWEHYSLLERYVAAHGRPPSYRSCYQGFGLGLWCNKQRRARRGTHGRALTPKQVRALSALPGWRWEPPARDWSQILELLKQYCTQYGKPPSQRVEYQGVKLGNWCDTQRRILRGTCTGQPLSAVKVQALNEVPGWWWESSTRAF